MQTEIKIITLPLPFRMGAVNCYLLKSDTSYILIDTGSKNSRKDLVPELESSGCKPGLLKLIILTHGDFDHTGNAAFLRKTFGGKIAMHPGDIGMVETGDMFANRKKPAFLMRMILSIFTGFMKPERFNPDLFIQDGNDLSEHGLGARVLSIPGHSSGSVGIITAEGDLFCGDLLENLKTPALGSLTDDVSAARESLQRLKSMGICTVYPGHGAPFLMSQVETG